MSSPMFLSCVKKLTFHMYMSLLKKYVTYFPVLFFYVYICLLGNIVDLLFIYFTNFHAFYFSRYSFFFMCYPAHRPLYKKKTNFNTMEFMEQKGSYMLLLHISTDLNLIGKSKMRSLFPKVVTVKLFLALETYPIS